jgi:hypothetical protein
MAKATSSGTEVEMGTRCRIAVVGPAGKGRMGGGEGEGEGRGGGVYMNRKQVEEHRKLLRNASLEKGECACKKKRSSTLAKRSVPPL